MSEARDRLLASSAAEARRLVGHPIHSVTPSRRDFLQYVATQKAELAVIARIAAASREALLAHAVACDDAEVAALAVRALEDGISTDDLQAIANAVTAPLLRDVPVVDESQIYFARLRGVDAVLLPASEHAADRLHELAAVASSLHMAAVIAAGDAAELDLALQQPHAAIGLSCMTAGGGLDVERIVQLAGQVPSARTLIVLAEVQNLAIADQLRGIVDAVVVGELLGQSDVGSMVARIATGH